MADLDTLSNDQLRLRLLECGFANLPVTQTTRNVLIKKLRNHLDGQKTKTKRETIHVMKYSSGEEDVDEQPTKKTNRRATMAVPTKAPPSPGRGIRRSVDRIAVEEKTRRNSRQTPQKKISVEDEESEEEAQVVRRNDRSKKSASPALSLSQTVTTTYSNKKTIVETEEPADEEEDDDVVEAPRRPSPARPGLERNTGLSKRQTFAIPSTSSSAYEQPDSYSSPKFSRPSLSTSYNTYSSPVTSRYGTTAAADSNGTFNIEYESPYLSDFTRRLSKLHAEPISPHMKPVIPKGTGVYYRTGKNSEVPLNQQNSSLSDDLWEVGRALGAYKKSITVIVVFLIFAYLFFNFL